MKQHYRCQVMPCILLREKSEQAMKMNDIYRQFLRILFLFTSKSNIKQL